MTILILAVVLLGGTMASVDAQDCGRAAVTIGDARTLGDTAVEVRFLEVIEDSRCPEGVDCIWAGNARIKVELSRYHKTRVVFEMNTIGENNSIEFDGFKITLEKLDPYPRDGVAIDKSMYVGTFSIKRE